MEVALLIKQVEQHLQHQRIGYLLRRLQRLLFPMQEAQDFLGPQLGIKPCGDIVHVGQAAKMQQTQEAALCHISEYGLHERDVRFRLRCNPWRTNHPTASQDHHEAAQRADRGGALFQIILDGLCRRILLGRMVFDFEQGVLGRIFFSDALEKRRGNALVLRFFCRCICGGRGGSTRSRILFFGTRRLFPIRPVMRHVRFFRCRRFIRRFSLLMQQERRIARRSSDDQLLGKTRKLHPVL